jgi:hypothetical protein
MQANYSSFEDQVKKSRRGPRFIGDESFSRYFFRLKDNNLIPQNTLIKQQLLSSTHTIYSILNSVYPPPRNPFDISLSEFNNLALEDAKELQIIAYEMCKDLIERAWKEGFSQLIICDRKIVYESRDIHDIPNEIVERIAKEHNKACYVFSSPDRVEDYDWTIVDDHDSYPTLGVYLGTKDSEENEIVNNSAPINADLDTGNPYLRVFDANHLSETLTSFSALQMRQGKHLGESYTYFYKELKICVKDQGGKIHSTVKDTRLVKDWKGCALLQTSPNRIGFIGRDLIRDLAVGVELDPFKKTTRVLNI